MKILRLILFALVLFLTLPMFAIAVPSFLNGLRAGGDVWSVQHSYFADAAVALIPALLALALAYGGAFRAKKQNWLYFVCAFGITLMMATAIPGYFGLPKHRAESALRMKMREIQQAADTWAVEHPQYPLNEQELAAALGKPRLQDGSMSRFQRKGAVLPYEFSVVVDAAGPVERAPRPGAIYYAVSPDGRRYWLTGTSLPDMVSETAVLVSESGSGPPFVAAGELPAPPEVRPARKKR